MRHLLLPLSLLFFCACQPGAETHSSDIALGLLLPDSALPVYEASVNHAALLNLNQDEAEDSYYRGQRIYGTTCFNCHGNPEQPGSIPNAQRFWADTFQHGSDPYSLYQVLSRGFGRMPPQIRLVPQEKYDVIRFIREEYLKTQNPSQYARVDSVYLASLPTGDTLGPPPQKWQPWAEMDYGRFWINTFELTGPQTPERVISGGPSPLPNEPYQDLNFAYKGIALQLDDQPGGVAAGRAWAMFDHDLLRTAGLWTGEGFIDWEGILLNDQHNIYPRTVGEQVFATPVGPAWANPETGSFQDPRFRAVDGRPFGPLPREWAHYKGLYYHGDRVVLQYTVGKATVLQTYDQEQAEPAIFSQTLEISPSPVPLKMRIGPDDLEVSLLGTGASLSVEQGFQVLNVPAETPVHVKLLLSRAGDQALLRYLSAAKAPLPLAQFTQGGPAHYPQELQSPIIVGPEKGAYAVDVLSLPVPTPWKSRMRPGGIDFYPEGDRALLCTLEGEVWEIKGLTQSAGTLRWKRIASGLYQPLGIKIREGEIFVTCRDQLVRLVDLNGDGETDFYESFNNDHQVTEHFHEFAMGLQTDEAGNFYYAKSARHARTPLVPHHGTLLKVSADGSQTEIVANGFRAANGVCRNPDGSFIVTDQEGHWNPMNRLNWVKPGEFYGNMYGYGAPEDTSDTGMVPPFVWVDSRYDRSPAELLWAESEQWGPLNDQLLSLSYGYGKVYVVLPEEVKGRRQGAIVELPVPQFPTGIMRGRFHPQDGQFYGCGMMAWGSSQVLQAGGLYRIRYTGKPLNLPLALHARTGGLEIQFSDPLDAKAVQETSRYQISTWALKRSHFYGSKRINPTKLPVTEVELSADGKTVFLHIPELAPNWIVETKYELRDAAGNAFQGALQGTIYELGERGI